MTLTEDDALEIGTETLREWLEKSEETGNYRGLSRHQLALMIQQHLRERWRQRQMKIRQGFGPAFFCACAMPVLGVASSVTCHRAFETSSSRRVERGISTE